MQRVADEQEDGTSSTETGVDDLEKVSIVTYLGRQTVNGKSFLACITSLRSESILDSYLCLPKWQNAVT